MHQITYNLINGQTIIGTPVKVDRGMVTVKISNTANDKRTIWIEDIKPVQPIHM